MKRNHVFLAAALIVFLDQIMKYIIKNNFNYTTNTGAAFGILQQYTNVLIFVSIIVAIALAYYIRKHPFIELGFILGGTLGNLIDRVAFGHVIDFINIGWWPSFNIADSFNTIGAILLAIRLMKKR